MTDGTAIPGLANGSYYRVHVGQRRCDPGRCRSGLPCTGCPGTHCFSALPIGLRDHARRPPVLPGRVRDDHRPGRRATPTTSTSSTPTTSGSRTASAPMVDITDSVLVPSQVDDYDGTSNGVVKIRSAASGDRRQPPGHRGHRDLHLGCQQRDDPARRRPDLRRQRPDGRRRRAQGAHRQGRRRRADRLRVGSRRRRYQHQDLEVLRDGRRSSCHRDHRGGDPARPGHRRQRAVGRQRRCRVGHLGRRPHRRRRLAGVRHGRQHHNHHGPPGANLVAWPRRDAGHDQPAARQRRVEHRRRRASSASPTPTRSSPATFASEVDIAGRVWAFRTLLAEARQGADLRDKATTDTGGLGADADSADNGGPGDPRRPAPCASTSPAAHASSAPTSPCPPASARSTPSPPPDGTVVAGSRRPGQGVQRLHARRLRDATALGADSDAACHGAGQPTRSTSCSTRSRRSPRPTGSTCWPRSRTTTWTRSRAPAAGAAAATPTHGRTWATRAPLASAAATAPSSAPRSSGSTTFQDPDDGHYYRSADRSGGFFDVGSDGLPRLHDAQQARLLGVDGHPARRAQPDARRGLRRERSSPRLATCTSRRTTR